MWSFCIHMGSIEFHHKSTRCDGRPLMVRKKRLTIQGKGPTFGRKWLTISGKGPTFSQMVTNWSTIWLTILSRPWKGPTNPKGPTIAKGLTKMVDPWWVKRSDLFKWSTISIKMVNQGSTIFQMVDPWSDPNGRPSRKKVQPFRKTARPWPEKVRPFAEMVTSWYSKMCDNTRPRGDKFRRFSEPNRTPRARFYPPGATESGRRGNVKKSQR